MAADGAAEFGLSSCCISHEFYKAASKSPNKIAVIHATCFARNARGSAAYSRADGGRTEFATAETRPPVYEGDECFTFSDILSAVDNLSRRLWRVLHGADDPSLIEPRSGLYLSAVIISVFLTKLELRWSIVGYITPLMNGRMIVFDIGNVI